MTRLAKTLSACFAAALVANFAAPRLAAEVQLPKIFSDGMVLQRDMPIRIWGRAEPAARVRVSIDQKSAEAVADANGDWRATLEALPAGGPHALAVESEGARVTLSDVLIGDVWIASGQSNMEWPLRNARDAEAEIAAADFPNIRHFEVEKSIQFLPQEDVAGGAWEAATPETAGDFTAVGYFFARALVDELDVPIGLIHTSWGGTDMETWTRWEVAAQHGDYGDIDRDALQAQADRTADLIPLYEEAVANDKGIAGQWHLPGTDVSDWQPIAVPAEWSATPIGAADGIAWFRLDFDLPADLGGEPALLSLGPIDDEDVTFLNGERVGHETVYDVPRAYPIAPGITRAGSNALVVKVVDGQGGGGFTGRPEALFLEIAGRKIPLAGDWLYKSSALTTDFGIVSASPNAYPSLLYNAMIHPLVGFPIKGAIWYQGENNASRAYDYRALFPAMIEDWRAQWGYDFPFVWAQLANYQAAAARPINSSWAELREAQDMTLALPNTGQAILVDIGEAGDIHPRNKQDVGLRLALAALHAAYGKDVAFSGPRYESMSVEGKAAVVRFEHAEGGLLVKGDEGELKGFAIAGADRKFFWAKARVEGDTVVVSSPEVGKPVAVRYAWADNPEGANLYNEAGLPAAPFRTDDWPGNTWPRK